MSDMNMRVSVAESKSKVLDMKPDIEWIEDFIYRAYAAELLEYKWMYEDLCK